MNFKPPSEAMYSIDGSDPVPFKQLYHHLRAKRGYEGPAGPFHIAEWLGLRGKELHEIRGIKRYIVGG